MRLLSVDDLSTDQVKELFSLADEIKEGREEMALKKDFVAVLLFEESSTRTRISFEAAIAQLGGTSIYVDAKTSQMARGETMPDTAKVISSYVDMIIARFDKHEELLELAKNSSAPVINALTHLDHPTQALSDLYTIKEIKGKLRGIKLAYIGDITCNTANAIMLLGTKMGMEISLVGPKSCIPNSKYLTKAMEYGIVKINDDIKEGVEDADVIYTDTYVSLGDEMEAQERRKLFMPYQLNSTVLSYAKNNAIVMHCLPAHRGEEITADVIDGPQSVVFPQAKNKLLLEKAIILYMSGAREET